LSRILVTGGAGFIGSHCIDRLLERGDHVVCVDNFNDAYKSEIKFGNLEHHLIPRNPNFKLVKADICDDGAMKKVFSENSFDKILHLAARAGVQPSFKDPEEFKRSNVSGTNKILELAEDYRVNNIVFASSSSVYGKNKKIPFSEKDPIQNTISPYAQTKKLTEMVAKACCWKGAHIAGLRFFTVYGPRSRPDMAMYLFTKAIDDGKTLELRGRVEQEISRDWTYVDDIVSGTLGVLDSVEDIRYEIFNIGCGKPILLTYFIELIAQELGKKPKIRPVPLPQGDVPITYADTSKLREFIPGWKPKVSIEEGIKRYVEWYRENC